MTHSARTALLGLLAAALVLPLVACGDDDAASGGSGSSGQELVVSAASSLNKAFTAYGGQFTDAKVRFSFAGSDELAAQIRQGVKPDVFAAANTKLPDQLYAEGLVEKPVKFATNQLVLAVPADGAAVTSIDDLSKEGVTLAIGAEGVPVGDYTRTVLERLPSGQGEKILANVRSNEPDVAGIVGKLTQGAVDAGFVYASDVAGAGGKLEAIELPDDLQPEVEYGAAIVKGAKHPDAARAFIDGLLDGAGADALCDNGFGPAPVP